MKKLLASGICLFFTLTATLMCHHAEAAFEDDDFIKHIKYKIFENECYMKTSSQDGFIFYKGKVKAYEEVYEYLLFK